MARRQFLTEAEVEEDIRQFLYNGNDSDSDNSDDLNSLYGDEAELIDRDDDEAEPIDNNVGVEKEIVPPMRQRRPKNN